MKFIALVSSAVALVASTQVHAFSLRCDGDLALIRDSQATILRKCGEPFFVESVCRPVIIEPDDDLPVARTGRVRAFVGCWQVDDWFYNPGEGQLITILHFEQGYLRSIRYGERVR